MGGVLVDYSQLGPYSPVRLSALGAGSAYDAISTVKGMYYKIWFSMSPQDPRVWTTLWNNKDTPQVYFERWNNNYANRFLIAKKPAVDNINGVIYLEGTAKSGETWQQLGMQAAWARLNPWYVGGGAWRGVETVQYYRILDNTGKDAAQAATVPDLPPGGDSGGDSGGDLFSGLTSSMPKIAGINVLWIGAAAAIVGGAVLLGRKKRG